MILVEKVKIDSKGRITIPSYFRTVLDLNPGDEVIMVLDLDRMHMKILRHGMEIVVCNTNIKNSEVEILHQLMTNNVIEAISCRNTSKGYECKFLLKLSMLMKTPLLDKVATICPEISLKSSLEE